MTDDFPASAAVLDERGLAYARLYREYVCTTRAARRLEYALRQLVLFDETSGEDDPDADVIAEIRRFFDRPIPELTDTLGISDRLAAELRSAAATSSTFARQTFDARFMDLNTGSGRRTELTEDLVRARARYEELTERLDALLALPAARASRSRRWAGDSSGPGGRSPASAPAAP